MGMFDNIRCQYPMPVEGANDLDYQTKSTPEQWLDNYEIREDGTLFHEAYESRTEDSPESPIGFYVRRDKLRWEAVNLTGEIRFYTSLPPKHSGWIEWSAYFVAGKLNQLHLIEHRLGTIV